MTTSRVYLGYIASEVTAFGSPVFYVPAIVFLARIGVAPWLPGLLTMLTTEVVCGVWKLAWPVPRPVPRRCESIIDRYDAGSFPSIHTARAVAFATWFCSVIHDPLLQAMAVALTLGVGWSRVHLREHFWRDVAGGTCFGVGLALLVQRFL